MLSDWFQTEQPMSFSLPRSVHFHVYVNVFFKCSKCVRSALLYVQVHTFEFLKRQWQLGFFHKNRSSCFSSFPVPVEKLARFKSTKVASVVFLWKCCRQPTLTLTRWQTSPHIQTHSCPLTRVNFTWPNNSRFNLHFWRDSTFQSWYVRHLSANCIRGTF